MKVGDLVEYEECPRYWGFILRESNTQYEIYWSDGVRSWIYKSAVKKK